MSIYHDCRAVIAVLGSFVCCLLMWGAALAVPVVCNVPDLHAHIQGKDARSPTRRYFFADTYLYLFKRDRPVAGVRVYGDQCRIATKRIGLVQRGIAAERIRHGEERHVAGFSGWTCLEHL